MNIITDMQAILGVTPDGIWGPKNLSSCGMGVINNRP